MSRKWQGWELEGVIGLEVYLSRIKRYIRKYNLRSTVVYTD